MRCVRTCWTRCNLRRSDKQPVIPDPCGMPIEPSSLILFSNAYFPGHFVIELISFRLNSLL